MTEPTDAEIMLEASKVGGLFDDLAIGYQSEDILKFTHAVLTRWGQPSEAGEPVAWRYRMKGDLQWQYTERPEQFTHADEVQPLATPQPTQPQAGAVPLTDEKKNAMWVAATIELPSPQSCYLRGIADAERVHGIGIKGGQHD